MHLPNNSSQKNAEPTKENYLTLIGTTCLVILLFILLVQSMPDDELKTDCLDGQEKDTITVQTLWSIPSLIPLLSDQYWLTAQDGQTFMVRDVALYQQIQPMLTYRITVQPNCVIAFAEELP